MLTGISQATRSDSLPDGWGWRLMDKLFRQAERMPATLSPLIRLAFMADRGMGALTYEPAEHTQLNAEDVKLLALVREAQALMNGQESKALKPLALLGGYPHGARPKLLVFYSAATQAISTQAMAGGMPWLVKFQAQNEHKEACAIEYLYARLATECELNMPPTAHFDLNKKLAGFGIERFDVEGGIRVPIHTLAGALLRPGFQCRSWRRTSDGRAGAWRKHHASADAGLGRKSQPKPFLGRQRGTAHAGRARALQTGYQ